MKSLVVSLVVLFVSASMSYAQAQGIGNGVNKNGEKEPFAVEFSRLSSYLQLTSSQMNEVSNINDYFIQMQKESLGRDAKVQEKKMQYAILGNLKLMRNALNEDQYRKYVTLLNVTNNNNGFVNVSGQSDVYLAEKK